MPGRFRVHLLQRQAFPAGKRYFRGVEVTAQKNLSDHWLLYASYLYGTLKGNFDGNFRAIGGFFARNPNITDDFDYPEFQVNAYGNLTLDRPQPGQAPGGVRLSLRPDDLGVRLLRERHAALAHRLVERVQRAGALSHHARNERALAGHCTRWTCRPTTASSSAR